MDDALRQEQRYYARRELGLCVKCGMDIEEPGKYKLCAPCREKYRKRAEVPERRAWRKKYQKEYREEIDQMCTRIAIAVQQLVDAEDLNLPGYSVESSHRCWGCFWGTWCGDRFFCPIYETCIKAAVKREVSYDPI